MARLFVVLGWDVTSPIKTVFPFSSNFLEKLDGKGHLTGVGMLQRKFR